MLSLHFTKNWSTYTISTTRNTILEKLRPPQLLNRCPVFYGTRRFISVFTTARHSSLHQSTPPSTVSLRHILILYCHLRLGRQSHFSSGFPIITLSCFSLLLPRSSTWPAYFILHDFLNLIITFILRRSRMGTVSFYTSTSNKGAARTKMYTKSLTRDLKRMYSRLTLVRISINL